MSIKSMVMDSLGFVTDEDRQKWSAHEQAIQAEKERDGRSDFGKATVDGVSSAVLNYGSEVARRKLQAEEQRASDIRTVKKRRVIETTEEGREAYEDDGPELG